MNIVVVVCSRDRPDQLRACLAALATSLRPDDDRLVVDSASKDADTVASVVLDAGFRLARAELPGLSRARNVAIASSSADVIAFIDDDCVVGDRWTERIEAAFADPAVGFVTGVVAADRETRLPVAVTGADATARRFQRGDDPTRCGHGANMSFRRAALDAVGVFDEELGAGGRYPAAEDTDAFWRLLDGGWNGVFDPDIRVTHEQWRTTGEALHTSYRYGVGLGALAVKGRSRDRQGARRLLRAALWDNGLRRAGSNLRAGYQTGAAASFVRSAGAAIGAARAAVAPRRG
ncbi:MAG TPA: glycosyltransferase [Acidimicrobiales bacterium]|nr:glycosyltransferase [Acidimicrobiales bacterium]